jgi:hypothetical protein
LGTAYRVAPLEYPLIPHSLASTAAQKLEPPAPVLLILVEVLEPLTQLIHFLEYPSRFAMPARCDEAHTFIDACDEKFDASSTLSVRIRRRVDC